MDRQIHQMVGKGMKTRQSVVESKAQHGQRTVGIGFDSCPRPTLFGKETPPLAGILEVGIFLDDEVIVVYEFTAQGQPEGHQHQGNQAEANLGGSSQLSVALEFGFL